jgi:hypothetical protein
LLSQAFVVVLVSTLRGTLANIMDVAKLHQWRKGTCGGAAVFGSPACTLVDCHCDQKGKKLFNYYVTFQLLNEMEKFELTAQMLNTTKIKKLAGKMKDITIACATADDIWTQFSAMVTNGPLLAAGVSDLKDKFKKAVYEARARYQVESVTELVQIKPTIMEDPTTTPYDLKLIKFALQYEEAERVLEQSKLKKEAMSEALDVYSEALINSKYTNKTKPNWDELEGGRHDDLVPRGCGAAFLKQGVLVRTKAESTATGSSKRQTATSPSLSTASTRHKRKASLEDKHAFESETDLLSEEDAESNAAYSDFGDDYSEGTLQPHHKHMRAESTATLQSREGFGSQLAALGQTMNRNSSEMLKMRKQSMIIQKQHEDTERMKAENERRRLDIEEAKLGLKSPEGRK